MTERYALFLCAPNEPSGGVYDLARIGSMQECMEIAERSAHRSEAHIARMEDLTIVKIGEWDYTTSPLVGHPITWNYRWIEPDA